MASLLVLAACGGRGTIDGSGDSCAALDAGVILMCHGAVGVGDSGTVCSSRCDDDQGHAFESLCQGDSCGCLYEDALRCSCSYSDDRDSCDPSGTCCPSPWQ